MIEGDLIMDADGRLGVVLTIVEGFASIGIDIDNTIVGMVYFFDTQEEEIVYEEDVVVIGE